MLAYTVAQAVQFMYENGKLKKKPKISLKDGNANIVVTPTEEDYAEALHTFWVAQCGIHLLAHNYPQNVKLEHLKV
jgi:predicted DNA-binding antitoxin AbrB/MazE fold protein